MNLQAYHIILSELKQKITQARLKTAIIVNAELLNVYWEIGQTILTQQKQEGWGAKIIDTLAIDLKIAFPDFKGFSIRNLKYMRSFAEAYPEFSFVQPMVAQIPWTHHTIILDKVKANEERLFYISKTLEHNWSKNILISQIESNLVKRTGQAITNFESALPQPQSDLAKEILKNPYIFDFLGLGEDIQEKELEKAIIRHLKKFMLELGKGFAYVGNQKNIQVGEDDFFLDMLFYNFHLHCFVVFELKIGDFKPEYAGKLNFYINVVDEQLKSKDDRPTIGILLCKTPNETVIKYALKGITSPMRVAEYKLEKSLPKQLRRDMPTIEELEAEIEKTLRQIK